MPSYSDSPITYATSKSAAASNAARKRDRDAQRAAKSAASPNTAVGTEVSANTPAAKPATIRSGMSDYDVQVRQNYNQKLAGQSSASHTNATAPATQSVTSSGSTYSGGFTATTPSLPGSNPLQGNNRDRFKVNSTGSGRGNTNTIQVPKKDVPIGSPLVGTFGNNSAGTFIQNHRSGNLGTPGMISVAAGAPQYGADAAAAGVAGTTPPQTGVKTQSGAPYAPRTRNTKKADYLDAMGQQTTEGSFSFTLPENTSYEQGEQLEGILPVSESAAQNFGVWFLPYQLHRYMPGGDILGKIQNYESGKNVYPKLISALTPPKVAEPRETGVIQTELQKTQEEYAAKVQELEDFTRQNQTVFQAEGLFGSATDHHVAEVKWQQEALRTELRDLEDHIMHLKEELSQSRQNDWGALSQNEDFEKYVQIGAEMKNPTWEDVNDPENIDPLSDPEERGSRVGNIVTFSMDNKDHLEYATKRDVGNAAYTYMTDEEVKIYNYLLGKYDKGTAQIYLDSLENTLNYRYGAEAATQYTDIENPFWRTVASMPYAFAAGVDQFASGINQLFHEKEQPVTPMQYASQTIQQSLGTGGQITYGVSNVVGNMLPSMLIGKGLGTVGSALGMGAKGAGILASAGGSVSMGASSAGNAYTQALQEGYSKEQARTYAALVGVSEAGLTYFLNGVGKLPGVGEKALLGKVKTLDSTFAKMALTGVIKVGSEVLEEELQLQLEPLFRTMVFDEEYAAPTGKEMLETAVIAALTTGVVEGANVAGVQVDFGKFGEMVMQNPAGRETVAAAMEGSRPDSEAGKLAQRLVEQSTSGKPFSTEDIGKLYTIVQTDTQTGKTVKSEGKVMELLQEAMAQSADSQAYQLAADLSAQLDTALTELGLDASELYQMSRADQIQLIEQVTDKVLNDQTIGELARLVEQEKLTDIPDRDTVEMQHVLIEPQSSLLQELKDNNIKFSEEDLLFITRDQTGQIVWLETGNPGAGLEHIEIRHAADFKAKHGVEPSQLKEYLEKIFTFGKIQYGRVTQRNGKNGYERLYEYDGDYYVLSGVGINGFIVTAYPIDTDVAVKLIERYKNEKNS